MPTIWSDSYLQRLANDAELDIVLKRIINVWARKSYATVAETATITLASDVLDITAVTWKGKPLSPLSTIELEAMDQNYRASIHSEPQFYTRQMDGGYVLRLYPCPNESLSIDDTDLYTGAGIRRRLIVSYWRRPDNASNYFELPDYIARRLIKVGVLQEAFAAEGKGQNLQAAEYYKNKKDVMYSLVQKIAQKRQRAKKRQIGPSGRFGRPKRVGLHPDFTING